MMAKIVSTKGVYEDFKQYWTLKMQFLLASANFLTIMSKVVNSNEFWESSTSASPIGTKIF